ncbi:glycosyltransferase family 4 protein [Aureispira anguillae]|uniref:Glycosyltransferase family 4 protein n=1 Tax=Aureispira anguillae TaxID=2864201 RepID=A0A915VMS6_9BACT|nr:glycosyltransferase family 4 protein [Aureispira anguillae]BDS09654.1 glycosyltransferase family 4 protein [Aureispira anguillae]
MKVLFVSRPTIFSIPGGDTIQMQFTAKYLRQLGVEVDILSDSLTPQYEEYDLVHYFNITRPAVILDSIRASSKPYILSPIFVDYGFYRHLNQKKLFCFLTRMFGSDGIEYLKTIAKHLFKDEKIPYIPYLWLGQKKSIQKILKNAACLLPNSLSENARLQASYQVERPFTVIPNGVDLNKFKTTAKPIRQKKQLICVARIEPMKNQLNLIKAIQGSDYQLKIIGDSAPNHNNYYQECKKTAGENVEFIARIPQEELVAHYLTAEVHILPSWFETTGLVSLEAAYLGCKVVISPKGDTKDYFKDYAYYCQPDSPESIRAAIDQAVEAAYSPLLRNLIIKEYNWQNAAKLTYTAYSNILNTKG